MMIKNVEVDDVISSLSSSTCLVDLQQDLFQNYHCNSNNNDDIKYSVDTTRSATTHTTTHMLNAYREQLMKLYTNTDTKIEDFLSNNSTSTSNFDL